MTWVSFVEYFDMVQRGGDDAVSRNYDLDHLNGSKPGIVLDRAAERMGLAQYRTPRAHLLPLISQMLVNVQRQPPPNLDQIVRQWYTWDRIKKGDLLKWPMKQRENPLLI